jgi:hypothetical protein
LINSITNEGGGDPRDIVVISVTKAYETQHFSTLIATVHSQAMEIIGVVPDNFVYRISKKKKIIIISVFPFLRSNESQLL